MNTTHNKLRSNAVTLSGRNLNAHYARFWIKCHNRQTWRLVLNSRGITCNCNIRNDSKIDDNGDFRAFPFYDNTLNIRISYKST